MELLNQTIHPFNGLDDIKLLESFDEVKEYLKQNNIKYSMRQTMR